MNGKCSAIAKISSYYKFFDSHGNSPETGLQTSTSPRKAIQMTYENPENMKEYLRKRYAGEINPNTEIDIDAATFTPSTRASAVRTPAALWSPFAASAPDLPASPPSVLDVDEPPHQPSLPSNVRLCSECQAALGHKENCSKFVSIYLFFLIEE